jgi:protein required for attachment to host cells
MEPRHDPHELEKESFGRYVASVVNAAAGRKAFDQLVLVAPPRALGVLRAALDEHARGRLVGEVAKDLVRMPLDKLVEHLPKIKGT